jgi:predicted HNH restriction endonuclease
MAKNNNLIYDIFWNGKKRSLIDQEYQALLTPFSIRFVEDIALFKDYYTSFTKHRNTNRTSPYYITFKTITGIFVPFYVGYIKNSGLITQNKRLQINSNVPDFEKNDKYYAISFMPTGDDEIITILEMKQYIKNKKRSNSKNNSSLWIQFDNLQKAYEKKVLVIEEDPDKKRYIFRRSQTDILKKVLDVIFSSGYIDEENLEPSVVTSDLKLVSVDRLSRNSSLRFEILKKANFTCQLCNKKETFQDKNNTWYFEAHHIIPFNLENQKKFSVTLDHLSNLVCLCPECHRKVHFSSLNEQLAALEKIINIKPLLKQHYSISNSTQLLDFYKGE